MTQTLVPLGMRTWEKFQADRGGDMAASLAYYALFSLFPLLLVSLSVLGFVAGPSSDTRADILRLAAESLPPDAYEVVQNALTSLTENRGSVGLIGFATLLMGASGFFGALDKSFDTIWGVTPQPSKGGLLGSALAVARDKAFAFALVLGCVLVVLLSTIANLVIGVLLNATSDLTGSLTYLALDDVLLAQVIQLGVSFVALAVVLALLYRVLPLAHVAWGDVWLPALLVALLFLALQRLVVGGVVNLGASYQGYGVIGGVLLLMYWLYLSLQLLLLGAELSFAFAELHGSRRARAAAAALPTPAAAGAATAAVAAAPDDDPAARAAGIGVLVGALATLTLSAAALTLGVARAIRALRRQ